MRPFAAHVIAESLRLALTDWQPGDAPPVAPLDDATVAAREARVDVDVALASERARSDRDRAARQAIAADPTLRAQLAELIGPPGGSAAGTWDTPATAAPAPSLDTEGIPQHELQYTDRFSQQRFHQDGRITAGALALQPSRRARNSPTPADHDGHDCCQDRRNPQSARTLLGRRPEMERDGELAVLVLALRCRSWRCPCCKHRLRARNRKRALAGTMRPGDQVWFATVTIDPSSARYRGWLADTWPKTAARAARGRRVVGPHGTVIESGGRLLTGRQATARASIPYASASWNRLRGSLDREFGGKLRYYRAIELHQSGMAHVHLLLRTGGGKAGWFLAFAKFRRLLVRAGFGQVTDVQLIATKEKAARYVTKMTAGYTSKDAELMPRWTRRGTWSRDWCEWTKATPIAGFTWELVRASADLVGDGFLDDGFRLLDPGAFRVRPAPA